MTTPHQASARQTFDASISWRETRAACEPMRSWPSRASLIGRTGLMALSFALLGACASSGGDGTGGFWSPISTARAGAQALPPQLVPREPVVPVAGPALATVVMYRLADEGATTARRRPVNVYIDGDYHASLQPDMQTTAVMCAGTNRFSLMLDDTQAALKDKSGGGTDLRLTPGSTQYFRVVVAADGAGALQPVPPAQAEQELRRATRKVQTISRLSQGACGQPRVASAAPSTSAPVAAATTAPSANGATSVRTYALKAAGLFGYKQSTLAGMTPEGRAELERMAADIALADNRVQRVQVEAFADPVGGAAYNLTLSDARAKSVAQALAKAGVPPEKITATGRGQQSLVVADCARKFSSKADINACNEQNRRIEVRVTGLGR